MKYSFIALIICLAVPGLFAQSNRFKSYSESSTRTEKVPQPTPTPAPSGKADEVVRVDTDLVTVPVRISEKSGRPVPDIKQSEFRIIENGVEQEVAYFQNEDQP